MDVHFWKRQAILGHRNTTPKWMSVLLPEKCPGIKKNYRYTSAFLLSTLRFQVFLLASRFPVVISEFLLKATSLDLFAFL